MAPASNEEQFKFLISCIRYSNNGKVDFSQVAKECKIVSKGAAAKRYERMMRAHGIASNASTVKSAPRSLKNERTGSTPSSTSSPTAKKRKGDHFLEDDVATDDDEAFGTVKTEPALTKTEQLVVKEEEERKLQPGQLSLDEAANLLQYYDTPAQYAGIRMGMGDGYNRDYSAVQDYGGSMSAPSMTGSSMGGLYDMESQQPYGFPSKNSYGSSGTEGQRTSELQRMSYQPRMQYSADEQGRADSPWIVE
ncbi:hypothetical protein BKA64DRAFT_741079 [Cadophora sp. MPI-SDFR-AT-0126]|nr:hypothetical protein BKA64DRAFT_741079 [Leotiomycetes sp. MPI-SDFR-AT-0126]